MTIRIFLADDHAVVRQGLRALLDADPEIEVVGESADGRDAVRQVKQLKPDVTILDVAMPELNGIEAALKIHEIDPGIGIVVLSMYSTREHVVRALRAGASGYLLKESAVVEVIDAVREVSRGRKYLSAKLTEELGDGFLQTENAASIATPLERLSGREREILQLVAEGKTSAEIGRDLFISPKTVDTYRSRLMAKIGVEDVAGLVRFAMQHGIVSGG